MANCNCFYDDALTEYVNPTANQTLFLVLKTFYDFGANRFARTSKLLIK